MAVDRRATGAFAQQPDGVRPRFPRKEGREGGKRGAGLALGRRIPTKKAPAGTREALPNAALTGLLTARERAATVVGAKPTTGCKEIV
jgi:hypothetical protein